MLISRLGSPQRAVDGILEDRGSAGHTIRGGMSSLFLSLKVSGYRFKAVLWILIMLFVLLCELMVSSVVLFDPVHPCADSIFCDVEKAGK